MLKNKSAHTPLYLCHQGFNWHLRPEKADIGCAEAQGDVAKTSNQDPDIAGILVINGMKVLYLNHTAYQFLHTFMRSGGNIGRTIRHMVLRHGLALKRARNDWQQLYHDLLQASAGCCEGTGIQIMGTERHFAAPLRVDLALTYRCNNDCAHCYAGGHHETAELTTTEWRAVIDKLHAAGVPQVVFTGGESLLRPDLEELVAKAKSLHMITGLITNGRLLTPERVESLTHAGLDFVQITVESLDPVIHNDMVGVPETPGINALTETLAGVKTALASTLQVTTNTTITMKNATTILPTINLLVNMGVKRIGVNGLIRAERGKTADEPEISVMQELLTDVRNLCLERGVQLIWFTPTCYQHLNPISLQLDVKSCSAASIVIAIEPTGRVIPCQSYFEGLGDARSDSFEQIWHHPLAKRIREKQWVSADCRQCQNFRACGGGCPLENMP